MKGTEFDVQRAATAANNLRRAIDDFNSALKLAMDAGLSCHISGHQVGGISGGTHNSIPGLVALRVDAIKSKVEF